MLTLTTISIFLALVMTAASASLLVRLRTTRLELERTQRRMARLDELADNFAELETDAIERTRAAAEDFEELDEEELIELVEKYPEPEFVMSVPAAAEFETGLQFDSESMFDDDFAPPGMAVSAHNPRRQKPSRRHYKTPVGSPRNNTPRSMESIVAVGSIQVRSDEISRQPED